MTIDLIPPGSMVVPQRADEHYQQSIDSLQREIVRLEAVIAHKDVEIARNNVDLEAAQFTVSQLAKKVAGLEKIVESAQRIDLARAAKIDDLEHKLLSTITKRVRAQERGDTLARELLHFNSVHQDVCQATADEIRDLKRQVHILQDDADRRALWADRLRDLASKLCDQCDCDEISDTGAHAVSRQIYFATRKL